MTTNIHVKYNIREVEREGYLIGIFTTDHCIHGVVVDSKTHKFLDLSIGDLEVCDMDEIILS